jgi:hypothetical protein
MKSLQKIRFRLVRISAMLLMVFMLSVAWAQDKGVDINVDIDKKGGNWYNNPVVYVIGGAVFILLLVALLKNNKSSS